MRTIISLGGLLLTVILLNVIQTVVTPVNVIMLYSLAYFLQTGNFKKSTALICISSLIQDTILVIPLSTFAFSWIICFMPFLFTMRLINHLIKTMQPYIKMLISAAILTAAMLSHATVIKLLSGAGRTMLDIHIVATIILSIVAAYVINRRIDRIEVN